MENATPTTEPTREEILATSLAARDQEIMLYQINIDNYTIALNEINNMSAEERAEVGSFADQLTELLASEKREQMKAKIMRTALQRQMP